MSEPDVFHPDIVCEVSMLRTEVEYYRQLLLTDMNPQNTLELNSLRCIRDVVDENTRLRNGSEIQRLWLLCDALEKENHALEQALDQFDKPAGEISLILYRISVFQGWQIGQLRE